MRSLALAVAALLALNVAARAEDGYGRLDFSRLTKTQEDFFWRRLRSLAIEEAVLDYCGQKDDFPTRASEGIRACVTKEALAKAQSFFEAERRSATATLHERKAVCHGGKGPERGWLGVEIAQAPNGVLVTSALPDSPAAADLKAGDVIASVDGEAVAGPKQLVEKIRARKPGATVALALTRDGAGRTAAVKLGGMAVDASGQTALDMPALVSSSRDDLAKIAAEVTDMCGKCKSSIWAVFCR